MVGQLCSEMSGHSVIAENKMGRAIRGWDNKRVSDGAR